LTIQRIDTVAELQALESDWQSLFGSGQHVHLANSYPYAIASATTRHRDTAWRVYGTRDGGTLTSVAFGMRSSLRLGRIEIPVFRLGTEFVADVLVKGTDRDHSLAALVLAIMDAEDVPIVEFGQLTEPAFRSITDALSTHRLGFTWSHEGYGYVVDTTIDRETLYARLSRSRREQLRRRARRLNSSFTVRVQQLASRELRDNLGWFEDFVELEASGWKGREGTSIRHRPGSEAYFRAIIESATSHGMMHWYRLLADEATIAMEMGMRTGAVFWTPKTAYDERFARFSPGSEMVHRLLLVCMEDPSIKKINWISAPPSMDSWRPTRLAYYRLRVYRKSLAGRSLRGATWLRDRLRRHLGAAGTEEADRERRFA
jgi:hypothetical protein